MKMHFVSTKTISIHISLGQNEIFKFFLVVYTWAMSILTCYSKKMNIKNIIDYNSDY